MAPQRETNWFVIGVTAAVVVVLAILAVAIVFVNNRPPSPGSVPRSSIVNEESGAISFGTGDDQIDTYVDFMCPVCGLLEASYGEQLQAAAVDNTITLNIHPVSILNSYSTTGQYSSLSAGSVYCVAVEAPDATLDYFNLLFAYQPDENSAGLSVADLSALAEQAGAGVAAECIADGTYMKFVDAQTNAHDITSTPTIEINGRRIDNSEIATELSRILG